MMDEEIRQAVSEVREMKQMCGNINMKLTNIVTQRGQNWKEKLEAEYQRGFEDGKAVNDKGCDGCKYAEMGSDTTICAECCNAYCNQWTAKQTDNEIKVGDEVEVLNSGNKYLIAWFAGTSICGFAHDGVTCRLQPSDVRKTGRHFDIASILKEMQS